MKKILILCLLAYASQAVAQRKSAKLDSLIENKTFAILVNHIEKKPGFNGPESHYSQVATFSKTNPTVLTPAQRAKILDIPIGANGSARVTQYYSLSEGDGSYFSTFNLDSKLTQINSNASSRVVFLVQDGNQLKVTVTKDPKNLLEMANHDYASFSNGNYTLTTKQRTNNGYSLTYNINDYRGKRKIYIDVDNEGKAVIKGKPTKDFTTVFYGNVISL